MSGPNLQGKLYILVGQYPKLIFDSEYWSEWMHTHDRCIARTKKKNLSGDSFHIVTSFCGVNMNWENGPPMLFETMLFIDGGGEILDRYSTYHAALKGHGRHVEYYSTR